MAFDLATAYIRTGLQPTPENEAILQLTLDATLQSVEKYLDRKIMYLADVHQFFYTHEQDYNLERYPVEKVDSIILDGTPISIQYKVHSSSGMLKLDHYVFKRELEVSYSGGYKILPADLELALWVLFEEMLPLVQGGSSSVSAGAIDSITVQDVGTIRFNTNSGGSGSGAISSISGMPDSVLALINHYRRYSA
jgi:hypothetical protein